jgi:hypothetical protein
VLSEEGSDLGSCDLTSQKRDVGTRFLSPANSALRLAPKSVRAIAQLHSLIAIKRNAEPRVVVIGEFEPDRLDWLAVGREHNQMPYLKVQTVD